MAYFSHAANTQHYMTEWESLLRYIKTKWPPEQAEHLGDLEHHIEAKALYVFTMARRLMRAAANLANEANGWRPIFTEASTLLFPMIELVGEARLGNAPDDQPWRSLASGIDWLLNPDTLPQSNRTPFIGDDTNRVTTLGSYMTSLPTGPTFQELYHLRNYLAHGLKRIRSSGFSIEALQTSMNYQLPEAIVRQAYAGLVIYWRQLKNESGGESREWVTRLAQSDIYPFSISGSGIFEAGVIDPDIIYWLSNLQGPGKANRS
jgi:hypothetical protein